MFQNIAAAHYYFEITVVDSFLIINKEAHTWCFNIFEGCLSV